MRQNVRGPSHIISSTSYVTRGRAEGRLAIGLSLLYLACHALAIVCLPDQATTLSLAFLVMVPILPALACLRRASLAPDPAEWVAVALAMILWSAGMAATMFGVLYIRTGDGILGISMLFFVLYGVPLIFAVASTKHELWYVRVVDGALALALGYLFFVYTFTFATATGYGEEGMQMLRLMFDIENAFIAVFSLIRFIASTDPARRSFFGILTAFAFVYMAAAAYINHLQVDTHYGTLIDLVPDLPFLLLCVCALTLGRHPVAAKAPRVASRASNLVRAGSPLMLAVTLLVVSGLLVHRETSLAIVGFVIAALGTGLRNVIVQAHSFRNAEKLDELSRIDALTGLANRRQFDDVLQREWSRIRRSGDGLALLMIDIDHFKLLNDHLGHPVGDERLRAVGKALAGCVMRSSDLVARYGGEEFAAILPATDATEAAAIAENMRASVAQLQLASPAEKGYVTISLGVGYVQNAGADGPGELLKMADTALYAAKRGGRDRVALAPGRQTGRRFA